ncbi:LCCL domain containing protein [Pseudohyphozyma bogoriensis]|nr:LCCL domain containing protein [Pseudohyphozyma bogoriensis]
MESRGSFPITFSRPSSDGRLARTDDDVELGTRDPSGETEERASIFRTHSRHATADSDSTRGKNELTELHVESAGAGADDEGLPYFDSRAAKANEAQIPSTSSSPPPQPRNPYTPPITPFEQAVVAWWTRRSTEFLAGHPRWNRVLTYARGASPPLVETAVKPFFPRTERRFDSLFAPIQRARNIVVPLFLIAWFLAFTFLVRASYFTSSTSAGAPQWIGTSDSFWDAQDSCGLNGTYCTPFSNTTLLFRCPAQSLSTELLNVRAVGADEVIYEPLVVGGLDDQFTYRADSWICASAIHHGLFGNREGGCGALEQVGAFTGYVGGKKNGIDSVGFDTYFPSSYRFMDSVSQKDCQDLRDQILGMNVAMTFILTFIIRPVSVILYWVLFVMGFWHVCLISDPNATPRQCPSPATGFQYFLPALFIGYAFWRFSWRYVLPPFSYATMERTVWYLGGYWVGLLINVTTAWIPIDRLTPHDIQQEPGGLVAVIILVIFLVLVILNQLRVIRRTGWFFFYLFWYVFWAIVICLLLTLPGLEFRLHHYFAAMVLMPGCAFVTRPSALFQGFLLGMFLDGAGRWGFDSILQTPASLVGDGSTGSALPIWITSAANFTIDQSAIWWDAIPADLTSQWDGFALIIDDVLAWTGTATNYSIAALDASLPHYFRLAYQLEGTSGDFTRAATAFINNGTWIDAAAGAG